MSTRIHPTPPQPQSQSCENNNNNDDNNDDNINNNTEKINNTNTTNNNNSTLVKPKPRKTQELIQEEAERLFQQQQQQQKNINPVRGRTTSCDRRDVICMDSDDVGDDDDDDDSSYDDGDDDSRYFRGGLFTPPDTARSTIQRHTTPRDNLKVDILSDDDKGHNRQRFSSTSYSSSNGSYSDEEDDSSGSYEEDEDSELEQIGATSNTVTIQNYRPGNIPSGRLDNESNMNDGSRTSNNTYSRDTSPFLPPRLAPSSGKILVNKESSNITIPHPHRSRQLSHTTLSMAYTDTDDDDDDDERGMNINNIHNDDRYYDSETLFSNVLDEEDAPLAHGKRWLMLFYISSLNLVSDWVCYSIAPISTLTQEAYQLDNPENLVVTFLSANVIATCFEPTLLKIFGFRGITVIGSGLLALAGLLKSTLFVKSKTNLFIAFFLSGLSQPLYQCTPTLLSSSWFPPTERTMATGVALNSNQLGIGVAFVAGTLMVEKIDDIYSYLNVIAIISVVIFFGVLLQFQSNPVTAGLVPAQSKNIHDTACPTKIDTTSGTNTTATATTTTQDVTPLLQNDINYNSTSNYSSPEKEPQHQPPSNGLEHVDNPEGGEFTGTSIPSLFVVYFSEKGFFHSTVAFVLSAVVINTLSTYMDFLIRLGQHTSARTVVGIFGGLFQFIILLSSLFFGKRTDESRAYFSITIFLLVFGAFMLAECGIYLDNTEGKNLRWCLLAVALLVGPLQPIATELGVDVTFPLGENGVLVIHQLFANLASASFIPVFERLSQKGNGPQYSVSFYCLVCIHAFASLIFATFNGRYKRLEWEERTKKQQSNDKNVATASGIKSDTDFSASEYEDDVGYHYQNRSFYA